MRDRYVLMCDCNCNNGFVFSPCDELYISAVYGGYRYKYGIIGSVVETIKTAFTKKYCLVESVVSKSDLQELLKYLKNADIDSEQASVKNESHLSITTDLGNGIYCVSLICDMKWYKVLLGKKYQCYEIVLNKRETQNLIKKLERRLGAKQTEKLATVL